ncbi:MAG TPA: hypothetical protein VKX17_17850 [Planctomycetota bacterium]|nr:hypothetical protein [Planctomycetota bacterium]
MNFRSRQTILATLFVAFALRATEEIKCPDIKDVWLSSANRSEADTNGGKAPRIKLKIYQEFGLLDFDVSKLKGKKIESAALFVAPDGGERFASKGRGGDLRWFTVSTVSSEWEEGLGQSYSKDEQGHGATFNEASYKTRPWTIPGSKCWDATLGNGNTLRCDVDAGDPKDGWFRIPLDVRLVQALVAGASHGLMIMDGSTGVDRNCTISTREGKNPPYLLVTINGDDTAAPAAPTNVKIAPAPNEATAAHGAAEVSLTVPEKAFAYQIKLNGQALPRWQIPFAGKAGTTQRFFLRYLPTDAEMKLEVAAVDLTGSHSEAVSTNGKSSGAVAVPAPAQMSTMLVFDLFDKWTPIDIYGIPEGTHVDAILGREIFTKDGSVKPNNVSYKGLTRLSAARGETATVLFAVENHLNGPSTFKIPATTDIDGCKVNYWKTWFVQVSGMWEAAYAIPLKPNQELRIPDEQNKILGQKFALIVCDIVVPADAKVGDHRGNLLGGTTWLHVHSAIIPSEIHFNPELNAYDEPGGAGSARFFDAHRLAHYNRCSINSVPYSQSGAMHGGCAPKIGADGHVTDWSEYDKNFGPLLDGSAFKDNPRAGVPVPVLFLPFNENYPLAMKGNYDPGCPLSGQDWKPKHDLLAKPPEQAFSKAYQDAFATCARDFAAHFAEKKYDRTLAECFFNGKWTYGKNALAGSAWNMDEPSAMLDWYALRFYSRLFHQGVADQKGTHLIFRGDISRPMWQGNFMDGLMELMNANNEQFQMPQLMHDDARRMPTILYTYGEANSLDRSNLETVAWCLKAYCCGCDGVVPWQSLGDDSAFDVGDKPGNGNALIVDGSKRFGVNAIASLRVHAFRQGAQLCELLRLLEIKKGWSRAHSGALVSQIIPLGSQFKQGFADDAAPLKFEKLNADDFVRLKEAILKMLDE